LTKPLEKKSKFHEHVDQAVEGLKFIDYVQDCMNDAVAELKEDLELEASGVEKITDLNQIFNKGA